MKVYISADIEGVAGITSPDEANPEHKDTKVFQEQMTREVAAACEGAIAAGAKEIVVKDAHWTGRNIDLRQLPECVTLVRGWSGHPYSMMQELDSSFNSVLYIGYHARAGSGGNPLAHTMSGRVVGEMRVNDVPASEFRLNTYTATMCGVPAAFLSGDEALCGEVRGYNEAIRTVTTFRGIGPSTVAVHPAVVLRQIRAAVKDAVAAKVAMRPLPPAFKLEIDYKQPRDAYGKSFYPGAKLVNEATVRFETKDWMDALRMLKFVLLLCLCVLAAPAFADQFMGVEQAPIASDKKPKEEEAAPSPTPAAAPLPGAVHGHALIGGNSGEFAGTATIGYYFNRYFSVDLTGDYLSYQRPDIAGEQYGPEVDAVVHLVNPLPLTPFFGAGPGYQEWRRVYDGATFDKGHSATLSAFGGLHIRFSRYFGLQLQRRRLNYLEGAPIAFEDRKTREASSRVYDQIGFVVSF